MVFYDWTYLQSDDVLSRGVWNIGRVGSGTNTESKNQCFLEKFSIFENSRDFALKLQRVQGQRRYIISDICQKGPPHIRGDFRFQLERLEKAQKGNFIR